MGDPLYAIPILGGLHDGEVLEFAEHPPKTVQFAVLLADTDHDDGEVVHHFSLRQLTIPTPRGYEIRWHYEPL